MLLLFFFQWMMGEGGEGEGGEGGTPTSGARRRVGLFLRKRR
jgi:hypothetical protein